MSLTLSTARDEILGLFNEYWLFQTPVYNNGQAIEVEWQGVDTKKPPRPGKPLARIFIKHSQSSQRTFGATGARRFTRFGLVTVQVFAPIVRGNGLSLSEKLAIIARDAFEGRGTDSGIWFRNARTVEIGPDGTFFQYNVVVEFQYDEFK